MGMSDLHGPADDAESIATIHAALDAGVSQLDTGDYYATGENEMLVRRALEGRDRDAAVISVKFGVLRDPAGGWTGARWTRQLRSCSWSSLSRWLASPPSSSVSTSR